MKFRAWISICILGLLLTPPQTVAQERTVIAQSGSTLLNATYKKTTVAITIRTVIVENGIADEFPLNRSVIQKLSFVVNSHTIFVPRSVFEDLVDPREASLRFEKGAFVLSVGGGDGADSYILKVYFDAIKVIRRTLYSALIPNKAVEETRYWQRVLKDE